MKPRHTCLPLALMFLAPVAGFAGDANVQSCRAIKDPAARLACYDSIPLSPPSASSSAPKAPGGPSTAAPAPRAPAPADQFGLEARRAPNVPDSVESHIPGRFEGWYANDRITLANGQVWKVADGSSGALWIENPKVRVRRGVLGTFYMEIEGTNRAPRVVREK